MPVKKFENDKTVNNLQTTLDCGICVQNTCAEVAPITSGLHQDSLALYRVGYLKDPLLFIDYLCLTRGEYPDSNKQYSIHEHVSVTSVSLFIK